MFLLRLTFVKCQHISRISCCLLRSTQYDLFNFQCHSLSRAKFLVISELVAQSMFTNTSGKRLFNRFRLSALWGSLRPKKLEVSIFFKSNKFCRNFREVKPMKEKKEKDLFRKNATKFYQMILRFLRLKFLYRRYAIAFSHLGWESFGGFVTGKSLGKLIASGQLFNSHSKLFLIALNWLKSYQIKT